MCCGEFARKVGDEGLFQKLASANILSIKSVQASALVTYCPHCFHTIKDDYPQGREISNFASYAGLR
jgi:Fe-S oxidoreductase